MADIFDRVDDLQTRVDDLSRLEREARGEQLELAGTLGGLEKRLESLERRLDGPTELDAVGRTLLGSALAITVCVIVLVVLAVVR